MEDSLENLLEKALLLVLQAANAERRRADSRSATSFVIKMESLNTETGRCRLS